MNSFKRVRTFQIELEFGNVGFFSTSKAREKRRGDEFVGFWGEGKTGVPGGKPLGARERTNNTLNPHMASTLGVKPGPHWWEASALTTLGCATLAPRLLEGFLFGDSSSSNRTPGLWQRLDTFLLFNYWQQHKVLQLSLLQQVITNC